MKEKMSFEDAIVALEEEVRRLEGGSLSLDESLLAFEKAVKLVKYCNAKIEAAEQKVRILIEDNDGGVSDASFTESDEN